MPRVPNRRPVRRQYLERLERREVRSVTFVDSGHYSGWGWPGCELFRAVVLTVRCRWERLVMLRNFVLLTTMARSSLVAESARSQQMTFPGPDWHEVEPEALLVDSARLQTAVEFMEANLPRDGADQLVIVRNGRMILERSGC